MPGRAIATGPDLRAAKATDAGTTTSASEASATEPLGRGITWDEKSTRQRTLRDKRSLSIAILPFAERCTAQSEASSGSAEHIVFTFGECA